MTSSTSTAGFLGRLALACYRARFVVPSLLTHLVIIFLAGGTVLIHREVTQPDFAGGGAIIARDVPLAPPPDTALITPQEFAAPVDGPTPAMTPIAVVTSTTLAPTEFNLVRHDTRSVGNLPGDIGRIAEMAGKGAGAGIGRGTMGGMGNAFGTMQKKPNALVGTFYDLKQSRRKKPTGISPEEYHSVFRRFVRENWRDSLLADYFQAPDPLYAAQIMIPNMPADEGPRAFGMEKEAQPSRWLVHYRGRVSPPVDGTFRFVGAGDDVMVVRFNHKVVLDRCWSQDAAEWKAGRNYDYGWTKIPNGFARGDAVKVRAGQWYDLEVLIGEQPGGLVFACLLAEQEGVPYEKDTRGHPILPIFRVAETGTPELQDGQTLPPHTADGPIWQARAGR